MDTRAYTIAVLDDDADFAFVTALTLQMCGYRTEVYDWPEDFLTRYAPKPGCVLLDVMMPGMDGFHVLRQMRDRQWTVPAITMTAGMGDVSPSAKVYPHWAGHVSKPFATDDLLRQVREALGEPTT